MRRPVSAVGKAADGTIRIFLAEALLLPTALATAGFLTRMLGPTGFGLLSLAATLVTWLEWTTSSLFARATFKVIAESRDWRATGAAVVWLTGLTSTAVAVALWLSAPSIASLLHEPRLTTYIQLFSIDIPIFALAQAHRNILVGIGEFRQRAVVSAWRWTTKMLLIILFVSAGLSVRGAIIGSVGASLVELAVSRYYVRPAFFPPKGYPLRPLWDYALPLFLAGVAARVLDKLDLFMLTSLGGTAAQAGHYGAAQNLSVVPGLLSLSLSALLLSTLSRLLSAGDQRGARGMARGAMRLVVLLVPFAAMTAGASTGIVTSIFGLAFAPAGPVLALLIFSALGLLMISVASAILTAAGQPMWVLGAAAPLVPLALVGHLVLIPRFGAEGAAAVTTAVSLLGAVATVWLVQRLWLEHPAPATIARCVVVSVGAYFAAAAWPASGLLLVLKLSVIMALIPLAYVVLGELSRAELAFVVAGVQRTTAPTGRPL